jgi:hypothetical protein
LSGQMLSGQMLSGPMLFEHMFPGQMPLVSNVISVTCQSDEIIKFYLNLGLQS